MSPSHGVTTVHRSRNQGDTGGMSPPPPPSPQYFSIHGVSCTKRHKFWARERENGEREGRRRRRKGEEALVYSTTSLKSRTVLRFFCVFF